MILHGNVKFVFLFCRVWIDGNGIPDIIAGLHGLIMHGTVIAIHAATRSFTLWGVHILAFLHIGILGIEDRSWREIRELAFLILRLWPDERGPG